MVQVHGSTEFISQPAITCNSSFILLFIDINAATASYNIKKSKSHKPHCRKWSKKENILYLKKKNQTFIVDTLGREKTVRGSNQSHTEVEEDEQNPKANLYLFYHDDHHYEKGPAK